jgi:hypothetical protein
VTAISSAVDWPNAPEVGGLTSTPSVSSRALKLGSETPAAIAAASWLDLWYAETALRIPGTAATA